MSKQVNPYEQYYNDPTNQSRETEAYLTAQQEISRRISQLAGIPNDRYRDVYKQTQAQYHAAQDRHEFEQFLESQKINDYDRRVNQEITSQLDALREAVKARKRKHPTHNDLMTKKFMSLSEIQRLTDALSLCVNNPEERESFDTIVKNWIADQLKQIEKEF